MFGIMGIEKQRLKMETKTFKSKHTEIFEGEYNIYLPNKNEKLPLLIYLHGYRSEYISPIEMRDQIPDGLIENSKESNFILACPLCPFGFYWRTTFVISFVRHIIETYKVNKSKIYLCGTSMGAYGTWATAHEFPDIFKGIAPVSGGVYEISQYQAHRFKNLAVWAFHNKGDEIIRCEDSVIMINSINKEGGSAKITIYEEESHDADKAFKNKELYKWFNSLT